MSRASRANTRASITQPTTVTSQPIMALKPYGASDAGNRKIPMPMVLPTTSAVHIQKPSLRWPSSTTSLAILMLRVRRTAFVGAVADPFPTLDHRAYVAEHVDVDDRIAFHRDQVGELAG